jgi:DeoR/GlpR family transcriptional regulator of sugar metabolism
MRYTEAPTRRAELIRRLSTDGYISSSEIASEFGVSEMTIRRDLHQLERDGLARRVAGGASVPVSPEDPLPFEDRNLAGAPQKRAIAALAARVITGSILALDAGTTVAALARLVAPGTTVITHSVPVISLLAARPDVELISTGGSYQRTTRAFAGTLAESYLEHLSADVAVLSATAIDDRGLSCANLMDAPMKRALGGIAARVVVLADSSKIGARAAIRVAPLSFVDTIITDNRASAAQLELLRASGTEVLVAQNYAGRA